MIHKLIQIITDPTGEIARLKAERDFLTGEIARLKAERDFLVDRLGTWRLVNKLGGTPSHTNYDSVGMSSNAMVRQAILNQEKPEGFPLDSADLLRCEETYRNAPEHLQKKMLPTLTKFREDLKVRRYQ